MANTENGNDEIKHKSYNTQNTMKKATNIIDFDEPNYVSDYNTRSVT